jgi:uncharacterized protein (DUF433 family)
MHAHPLLLPIVVHDELRGMVVSDLETLGGAPVFARSRVLIKALFDYVDSGESIDTLLDHFEGVEREQVERVLAARDRLLFPRKSA